eukprot:SM000050S17038  [mRNA]  locus=s50:539926:541412:- [translate_table: standard]
MAETNDGLEDTEEKVARLSTLVRDASARGGIVLHTGAGISTAAGVPDFRGPRGVWTLQAKGLVVQMAQPYESLQPTLAHRVIVELVALDGLHGRSGLPPASLSELHGCVFIEKCDKCGVCGAPLTDTIVHFGEKLDERVLHTAREVSGAAHLSLCIGTTLKSVLTRLRKMV